MSTNKVYGDKINELKFEETKSRYQPKENKKFKKYGVPKL